MSQAQEEEIGALRHAIFSECTLFQSLGFQTIPEILNLKDGKVVLRIIIYEVKTTKEYLKALEEQLRNAKYDKLIADPDSSELVAFIFDVQDNEINEVKLTQRAIAKIDYKNNIFQIYHDIILERVNK